MQAIGHLEHTWIGFVPYIVALKMCVSFRALQIAPRGLDTTTQAAENPNRSSIHKDRLG